MPNDADNLILQHLRAMRGDVVLVRETLSELVARVGHVERSVAELHVQVADQSLRLDRVHGRLDRIEKRLGLAEVV